MYQLKTFTILAIASVSVATLIHGCSGSSFSGKNRLSENKPSGSDDGTKDECLPVELPSTVVEPKKIYTFLPDGDNASFSQFVSTAAVGKLNSTDNAPAIFAIGFKKTSEPDGQQCHGFVYDPGRLFAIDGRDGTEKWIGRDSDNTPLDLDPVVPPAVADIDGDGKIESFAVERTTGKIVAFNSAGVMKWRSADSTGSRRTGSILSGWAHGISVADLDRDGLPEVIAPGMVLNATNGNLKFALTTGQHVYPADTNLSGNFEIVLTNGILNSDGQPICSFVKPLANIGIARLKGSDEFLTIIGPSLNNDPVNDPSKLIAYRGDNCGVVFEADMGDAGGGPPNIADFDGKEDKNLEIGIAGKRRYAVFSADGTLLWNKTTVDASSARTGSTAFDFNGDGKTEVVYNDEVSLRVFDGRSGDVVYETANSSYTAHEYPVVADVDGNGTANIIAVANNCGKRNDSGNFGVNVFAAPDDNWVNTRPLWSQHGFDPLAINDDATVTSVDPLKILKGALPSAHLAGYRNNISYPMRECQ